MGGLCGDRRTQGAFFRHCAKSWALTKQPFCFTASPDGCHVGRCCPGSLNCEMKSASSVKEEGRDLAHKSNCNKFLMNLAFHVARFMIHVSEAG